MSPESQEGKEKPNDGLGTKFESKGGRSLGVIPDEPKAGTGDSGRMSDRGLTRRIRTETTTLCEEILEVIEGWSILFTESNC